jgi:wyosine [tRNA(Phe)-imidazoG37] synthetase (radical SAM superfamily)
MNCRMTRGVFLRANGEVNCYCSTGEQVSLARLPQETTGWDFVADHYLAPGMARVRRAMAEERLPFPAHCLKCNYLDPAGSPQPELVEREVEWFHLEAAAVCNLRCPFCVHGIPEARRRYRRDKPHLLPPELHAKVMDDLAARGINVRWMYFSGRGEPGLHPGLWSMVAADKRRFDTDYLVNTNGNIPFDPAIVSSGLDKIKIALDAVDPEAYARYRRGGAVERVLGLTEAIAREKARRGAQSPAIIWQKVLFDYNDSDRELAAYQEAASRLGVDQIKLVFTWTEGGSDRRPQELELSFPEVQILDTYQRDNLSPAELERRLEGLRAAPGLAGWLDLVSRVLHWFEMGTENRDQYDLFAGLAPDDPRLFRLRRGHPALGAYAAALAEGLEGLAGAYDLRGLPAEARRYRAWAGGIRPPAPVRAAGGAA